MLNQLYSTLLASGRTETRRGLGPGLAPKTVRNLHGVLPKAFRDAVRWRRLQRNPVMPQTRLVAASLRCVPGTPTNFVSSRPQHASTDVERSGR